jgi:DUF1009 family protein
MPPIHAAKPLFAWGQPGGRVLAIEAGKTIVLDRDDTVALADTYGLTIVALSPNGLRE